MAEGSGSFSYQWYVVTGTSTRTPINGATTRSLEVEPSVTTKYCVKVTNACGTATSDTATVTVHEPPAAPVSVTVTSNGIRNTIAWTAAPSAVGIKRYEIQRRDGTQRSVNMPAALTVTDGTGVSPGFAYLYRVRAVDDHSVAGSWSAYDLTVTRTFADDPLVAATSTAGTVASGQHIGELRSAIDAVRNAAGLASSWMTYAPATGLISAVNILEMRSRLNEAREKLGFPAISFVNPTLTVGSSLVKAVDIQELRNGVK